MNKIKMIGSKRRFFRWLWKMQANFCGECAAPDCANRRAEYTADETESSESPVVRVVVSTNFPSESASVASEIFNVLKARNASPSAIIGSAAIILNYLAIRGGVDVDAVLAHLHMNMAQLSEMPGMTELSQKMREVDKSELN